MMTDPDSESTFPARRVTPVIPLPTALYGSRRIEWCEAVANGAKPELQFDGFGRNSFQLSDSQVRTHATVDSFTS